jgi:hypothetical protein
MANRSSQVRRFCLSVGVALAGFALSNGADGKPPAPPPPVPPSSGTVFYTTNSFNGIWAMRSDGSGKMLLPHPYISSFDFENGNRNLRAPSRLVYGSDPFVDRIWVTLAYDEYTTPQGTEWRGALFAYKFVNVGGTLVARTCRITNLHPDYFVDAGRTGVPAWSNGGDMFVAFPALQIANSQRTLLRAWVTGAEIDAAIAAGTNIDLDATAFGTGKLEVVATTNDLNSEFVKSSWSPDGTRVACELLGSDVRRFFVRTIATGLEIQLGTTQTTSGIDWSPNGARIAFANNRSISTINPDGTGLATPYGTFIAADQFSHCYWSPDPNATQQLVFSRYKFQRKEWARHVERGLATGGSTVILTGDLPPEGYKYPIAWVP